MRLPTQWLGVAPFFIFALMFLILPTAYLIARRVPERRGRVHARKHRGAVAAVDRRRLLDLDQGQPRLRASSARLIGLAIAIAIVRGGLPDWIRSATLTFSGVASNFAGVPLAFAFLATLGRLGLVTVLLERCSASTSMRLGFNILSFWGLTLTYLYFQIPLMVVIITPAIDGLKKEWGEAAATLGATQCAILAHGRHPGAVAELPRHRHPALRQRLRRHRHRLCADRLVAQHRADPALCADPRRRAAQSASRLCASPSA